MQNLDLMRRVPFGRLLPVVEDVLSKLRGEILIRRPAQSYVEDLHPPADAKNGHPAT